MPSSLQELFAEPLRHLGDEDPKLRGIHAPEAERGARKPGVTAQFLENAAQYHERYRNLDGMRGYLGGILGHRDGRVQVILDVGSGSGNSIIPLLDLYPHAYCVATDISPQLLAILRDELEGNPRHRGRYGLVCMDVNHDRFRAGAFDLAVGIAILHHIVDPRRVLRACANALAPGGMALFVEPFETGHGVLRMAYRRVLAEARHRGARDPGFGMLERMVVDHEARLRDKADPIFDRLDDKWYFTRTWLDDAASAPEWAHCRVEAIDAGPDPLVSHAREDLMHGLGAREDALPEWAWDEIRRHQRFFSREGLRDLLFDAAIILRRSEQACPSPSGARRAGWWWNPAEPGRGFFVDFSTQPTRVACCAYGEDGDADWCLAADASLDLSGPAGRIRLSLQGNTLELEPQHAGHAGGPQTGWWIEEGDAPGSSIVVEALGDRLMAALLEREGWSLVVATRRHADSFEGTWLRFHGGQALGGQYRAPAAPRELGPATLKWADGDCLVSRLPDGRQRLFARGPAGTAQNLRSTEKLAS